MHICWENDDLFVKLPGVSPRKPLFFYSFSTTRSTMLNLLRNGKKFLDLSGRRGFSFFVFQQRSSCVHFCWKKVLLKDRRRSKRRQNPVIFFCFPTTELLRPSMLEKFGYFFQHIKEDGACRWKNSKSRLKKELFSFHKSTEKPFFPTH